VVGAGELAVIRGIQIGMGSGHVEAFPMALLAFYMAVEILFGIVAFGAIRRASWAKIMAPVVLAAVVLVTFLSLQLNPWSPDFPRFAWIAEGVWLGPWVYLLWRLWSI
jgi:hypothetical protein